MTKLENRKIMALRVTQHRRSSRYMKPKFCIPHLIDSLYLKLARDQPIFRDREFEIERKKQVTAYTNGLRLQFEIERGSRQRVFEIERVNCITIYRRLLSKLEATKGGRSLNYNTLRKIAIYNLRYVDCVLAGWPRGLIPAEFSFCAIGLCKQDCLSKQIFVCFA